MTDSYRASEQDDQVNRGFADELDAFGKRKEASCDHDGQPVGVRRDKRPPFLPEISKPMHWTSLHHHSTYSYLDGFQLPEAHVRRATELNMSAIALTEHGNVASHVKLEQAAKEAGVKPIYGMEAYTGAVDEENRTQRKNHLTILAKTQDGYRNLLRLASRAYSEGFYYEATVSGRMLRELGKDLIVLSGCQGSLLFTSLVGGKHIEPEDASYKRGKEVARRFKAFFGERYFLEVQAFPGLDATNDANAMIARISRELKIPMVASLDCHYTIPTENEIQKVLHNVRPGETKSLEDMAREWGYAEALCPAFTDKILMRKLQATGLTKDEAIRAILTSEEIAQGIDAFDLPRLPMLRYPLPEGVESSHDLWRRWLKEGWEFRRCDRLRGSEKARYKARMKRELDVIESKDFIDYFLVVADAVRWAKDEGIVVGPARGSAAASLVCWLLRITEVNPMDYPLVFERFIDETRQDLPDIDLDFDADTRYRVREYLVSKYGEDCVNNVGTFTTYKAKLALDDVARVHRVPKFEVEKVKELLLERSSGDLRASATIEDTIEYFDDARAVVEEYPMLRQAMELEGNVKGFGVHAAGLVVSNGPITNVAAVVQRKVRGHDIQVVEMDKYDAERQGLLKLDFLGLKTMSVIAECCRGTAMTLDDLYSINLHDEKVIDGFRANDVAGVFQFEGRAMRSICGALKPDSFKEICDVNALARPGPLHNGAANEYIDIKRGVKQPNLAHPILDDITKDTNYQIVYQEQILRIVREIGNFDWTHASYIRRIISRKLGDAEFNRQWERFRDGAAELHPDVDQDVIKAIWGACTTAGSYAFNLAHCVSYGMIGYWCMYFKVYHPSVFYAACLSKLPKQQGSGSAGERGRGVTSGIKIDRHSRLLRDAARHDIEIVPPVLNVSGQTWREAEGKVAAGYTQIHGIGEKVAAKIVSAQEEEPFESWEALTRVSGIGPKTVEIIQAFCEKDDPFDVFAIDELLARTKASIAAGELGDIPEPTHNADEVPYEYSKRDTAIVWIGVPIHRNLRDIFEKNRARTGEELDPSKVKRPDLNEWVMIAGYDGEELVNLRFDRFNYPKFRRAIWDLKIGRDIVVAQGKKPGWRTAREIYVKRLWVIEPE